MRYNFLFMLFLILLSSCCVSNKRIEYLRVKGYDIAVHHYTYTSEDGANKLEKQEIETDDYDKRFQNALNKLGEKGWELIYIQDNIFFFKRKL